MGDGKVKASKAKVYSPPEGTGGLDGQFHVYIYDAFHKVFLTDHQAFDTIERAVAFQRHEQERIYAEQEAEPEFFDLPFVSTDPVLLERAGRDPEYAARLLRDLASDARQRGRKR